MMQQLETVTHHLSLGGRTGGAKLLVAAAKIELISQTPPSLTSFLRISRFEYELKFAKAKGAHTTIWSLVTPL